MLSLQCFYSFFSDATKSVHNLFMEKAANINANAKMVQSKCCVARLGANVVDTVYQSPKIGESRLSVS